MHPKLHRYAHAGPGPGHLSCHPITAASDRLTMTVGARLVPQGYPGPNPYAQPIRRRVLGSHRYTAAPNGAETVRTGRQAEQGPHGFPVHLVGLATHLVGFAFHLAWFSIHPAIRRSDRHPKTERRRYRHPLFAAPISDRLAKAE